MSARLTFEAARLVFTLSQYNTYVMSADIRITDVPILVCPASKHAALDTLIWTPV